jgi:hypothetical protein
MSDDAKQSYWSSVCFGIASAITGVTLPILWPRLSSMEAAAWTVVAVLLVFFSGVSAHRTHQGKRSFAGRGGAGGQAKSIGDDNDVQGGRGGAAKGGSGGKGGNATAVGNRSRVRGGAGGDGAH